MVMMDNQYKWMVYVGLEVLTLRGWATRGSSSFAPRGSLCHWIAGPRNVKPGRRPSLPVIRDGHSTLPGPLANQYMGRAGEVVLVAAGRCNHAGRGYWMGMTGNSDLMGTEPEAADNSDWTAEQRKSYPLVKIAELFAMWEKGLITWNQIASNRIAGHSEYALPKGRKIDINGYTMTSMRQQIAALIPGFKKRVNGKPITVGTQPIFDRNTYTFTDGTNTAITPKGQLTMSDVNKIMTELNKKASAAQVNQVYVRQREYQNETLDLIDSRASKSMVNSVYVRQREYQAETEELIRQLAEATGTEIDYDKVREASKQGAKEALAEGINIDAEAEVTFHTPDEDQNIEGA